jgi:hypothetical protein
MTDAELVHLYTSFKDDARGWLALHRQHFTQFVVIILGILGACIAAFVQLRSAHTMTSLLIIGPVVGGMLSVLAIFVCNKFYMRYAEHDAISYKLYRLLERQSGLREDLETVKDVFPDQADLFPQRWTNRLKAAPSIGRYADDRVWATDASNFYIMLTFGGLSVVSVLLAIMIAHG